MPTHPSSQPKPRSAKIRPEITRIPRLTIWRRAYRRMVRWICRLAIRLLTRPDVQGLSNFPQQGPALVVTNHLGDTDVVLGLAYLPAEVEALAKAELYDFPVLGKAMEAYGVIWVHRGQPDRRAIRTALETLGQGRLVGIAPEGRESITGGLEEGMGGAAYLALKAGVPVVPVTFTGTENSQIFGCLKRRRRPGVTLTVGKPFTLEQPSNHKPAVASATQRIMEALAKQLPPAYQGVYRVDETRPDETIQSS